MLQRDAPLPACAMRRRLGIGREVVGTFAWHGDRTIARQPMGPVFEPGLHRLFDDQPAKARTVDEQVGGKRFPAFKHDRIDIAIIGPQIDIDDLAFLPHDAAFFGIGSQETRIQTGVELIGVRNMPDRRIACVCAGRHELVFKRGRGVDREIGKIRRFTLQLHLQPILMAAQPAQILPDDPEPVDIARPDLVPVVELNAQLECALRQAHELHFIEAKQFIEFLDRRDRCLPHADGSDIFGFHQLDPV